MRPCTTPTCLALCWRRAHLCGSQRDASCRCGALGLRAGRQAQRGHRRGCVGAGSPGPLDPAAQSAQSAPRCCTRSLRTPLSFLQQGPPCTPEACLAQQGQKGKATCLVLVWLCCLYSYTARVPPPPPMPAGHVAVQGRPARAHLHRLWHSRVFGHPGPRAVRALRRRTHRTAG